MADLTKSLSDSVVIGEHQKGGTARYWIGNGGDWSETAHWSESSGGAGGASVPTATDNVYFDANSFSLAGQTVTTSGVVSDQIDCLDFVWTGATNNPTWLTECSQMNVWGSMTLIAAMTWSTSSYSSLAFCASTPGHTVTTNGIMISLWGSYLDFGYLDEGGEWTLQDAFTTNVEENDVLILSMGTLNTNGQAVTCGYFKTLGNNSVRVLTLGASTFTTNNWVMLHTGNFTLNAGTSNVVVNYANASGTFKIPGNGQAFYDVTLTSSNGQNTFDVGAEAPYTASFHNLTIAGSGNYTNNGWRFQDGMTLTVTGTFSVTGVSQIYKDAFTPSTSTGTITINAAAVSLTDAHFQNVTAGGAAAPWATTRCGDLGGNTNITFSAGINKYWVGNGGSWTDTANHWSDSTGGAPGANLPLPQDNAIFDAASFSLASQTITINSPHLCHDLDLSAVDSNPAITVSARCSIYGSLTMGANTMNYSSTWFTFAGSGSETITSNGITMNGAEWYINTPNGTYTLVDAFNASGNAIYLTAGTFDTADQTVTCGLFNSFDTTTRALDLGASTLNVSGQWNFGTHTNLTFTCGTSTIAYTGTSFSGGALTYNNVTFTSAGTINVSGAWTCANLTYTGSAAKTNKWGSSGNITITGTLTITGNSAINRVLFANYQSAASFGTAITVTAATTTISNVDFQDITAAGAGTWSGTSIGNAGGNTGITFTDAVDRYWIGGSGNWSATAEWSASSGGGGSASVPLPQDTAIFDGSSFAGAGLTVTVDMPRIGAMNWTDATNSPTLTFGITGISIHGSITLITAMTWTSSTTAVTLAMRPTATMGGGTIQTPITFNCPSGTVTLNGNFTMGAARTFTHTRGTLDADTYNFTVPLYSSSVSYTRALVMGSGTWTFNGTGNVFYNGYPTTNYTLTPETSTIVISDATATAKTFAGNSLTYNNLSITGDAITISGSNTWNSFGLNNAGVTTGLKLTSNTTQTVTTFVSNGAVGSPAKLISTSAGTAATIRLAGGGAISEDWISIKDSNATNGLWFAGANSTNVSGNTGWIFADTGALLSDSLTISEGLTRDVEYIKPLADSLDIAEGLTVNFVKDNSDTLSIASAVDLTFGKKLSDDPFEITEANVKVIKKAISDNLLIVSNIANLTSFKLSDSQSISESFGRIVEYHITLSDTVDFVDTLGKSVSSVFADSESFGESITKLAVNKVLADSQTISDSFSRIVEYHLSLSDVISIAESISNSPSIPLADAITFAEGLITKPGIGLTDALIILETLANQTTIGLSDALTSITEAHVKIIKIPNMFEAVNLVPTIRSKRIVKNFFETVTIADSTVIETALGATLYDSIGFTESLVIRLIKNFTETVDLYPTIAKDVVSVKTETLAIAEAVANQTTQSLSDSINITEQILAGGKPYFSDSITITESLKIVLRKAISDSQAISEALAKDIIKPFAESVNLASSMANVQALAHSDSISISETMAVVATFLRSFTESVTLAESNAKDIVKVISDAVGIADSEVEKEVRHFEDSATPFSETQVKTIVKVLTDTETIADSEGATYSLTLGDTLGIAEALGTVTAFRPVLDDSVTLGAGMVVSMVINKTESEPISENLANSYSLRLSDSVSIVESVLVLYIFPLADSLVITETINKKDIIKRMTETLTIAESSAPEGEKYLTPSDSMGIAESSIRKPVKIFTETVAIVESMKPVTGKGFSEAVTIVETSARVVEFHLTFSESITISDSQVPILIRPLTDNITFAESMRKRYTVNLSEALTLAEDFDSDKHPQERIGQMAFMRTRYM